VCEGLRQRDVEIEIHFQFGYAGIRNYPVSGKQIVNAPNYRPMISVEEAVVHYG
jgi:hypothetical protein